MSEPTNGAQNGAQRKRVPTPEEIQGGPQEIEMKDAVERVWDKTRDLYLKHGPMNPAEIGIHPRRAMGTFLPAYYAAVPDKARIIDRLEHLAAVCIRASIAAKEL